MSIFSKPRAPLPAPRFIPGVAVYGDKLFLVGGGKVASTTRVQDIDVATWQPGADLSPWKTVGSYPVAARDVGIVLAGGYMVGVSGNGVSGDIADVYTAKMTQDGPGPWKAQAPFPQPRNSALTLAAGKFIYNIGGFSNPTVFGTCWSSKIDASGNLSPWTAQPPLPQVLFGVGGVVHENWLFIGGGAFTLGSSDVISLVYRSRIDVNGNLSPWQLVGDFGTPRRGSGVEILGNRLYVIGGVKSGGGSSEVIQSAAINGDGSLSQFQTDAPLLTGIQGVRLAKIGDSLFLIGGTAAAITADITELKK